MSLLRRKVRTVSFPVEPVRVSDSVPTEIPWQATDGPDDEVRIAELNASHWKYACESLTALVEQLGDALNRAGYLAANEFPTNAAEHIDAIANANAAYHEWRTGREDA